MGQQGVSGKLTIIVISALAQLILLRHAPQLRPVICSNSIYTLLPSSWKDLIVTELRGCKVSHCNRPHSLSQCTFRGRARSAVKRSELQAQDCKALATTTSYTGE